MKYRLLLVIFCLILCVRCYHEDSLVSTEISEFKYTLPQGNHDYDAKILDWYERCGFYVLYKFEPKDVYWNINFWEELEKSVSSDVATGFKAEPADEAYAGDLLDIVERKFLNFYPDTMLRRCMSMKLLLCSELIQADFTRLHERGFLYGFDCLIVNYANENITSLPSRKIDLLKDTINMSFLNRLTLTKKIAMSSEFLDVSSYDNVTVDKKNMYEKGYIAPKSGGKRKEDDWKDFLKAIIKTPSTYLTAEPKDGDTSFKGILHEKKDVKGMIRKKYDILIRYFKDEYGVDLQKIGDSQEPTGE